MPTRSIADLDPVLQPICIEFMRQCMDKGLAVFITCTWRSNDEQTKLYAQGRTEPGKIVTHAQAGNSKHNYMIGDKPAAQAFDFAIMNDDNTVNWDAKSQPWQDAIQIGRSLGLIAGADWPGALKDSPHLELRLSPERTSPSS